VSFRPLYVLLMLLAGCSYGTISPLMKLAYQAGFDVQDVTDAQYGFAVVIIWLFALTRFRNLRIPRQQWKFLVLIGLTAAGVSYAYYVALTKLPASLGIVLLFQFAWMVLVIDIIVTRRKPGLEKWLGMVLIVIGTLFAVGLIGQPIGRFPVWAFALGLVAGFCYACVLYLSSYVTDEASPIIRSAITITVSSIAVSFIFPPTYLVSGVLWHGLWFWGLLVALFGQVFPMLLILLASPKIGGRMAGVLGAIELPVAVVASRLLLSEHVTPLRWLGVILILVGICVSELLNTTRLRRRSKHVPCTE
jgi:drug/metabolite transporter (DMT)-like permease